MTIFTKPFRVKSNTQMKGSDKKKLKASLKKSFPSLTDDQLSELLPMKEEIVVSKIFTFTEESILLYIHNKNTVFFEMEKEKQIFPTVYTLWKIPDLYPTFTTMPGIQEILFFLKTFKNHNFVAVMPRIANGADLMLPGVIINDEKGIKAYCDGRLAKGDTVAVNLASNKAPVAVGTAWLSSEDMYMAARKGKAVNIKHFYGDQLWAAGNREQLPDLGPPDLDFGVPEESDEEEGKTGEGGQQDTEVPGDNTSGAAEEEITDKLEQVNIDEGPDEQHPEPSIEEDTRTPQEIMDELLDNSLLQCLKTSFSQKKSEFPILTSNFFRLHMVAACPPGKQIDVKKSSYKKLSKYLEKKEKLGLLAIKELSKGVESIVSVNYDHEAIRGHRVVKYEKIEDDSEPVNAANCDTNSKYEPPVIQELYAVTAHVLKLFKTEDIGKGAALTVQQVRKILTNYVKNNDLKAETGGLIKMDPLLGEIVPGKAEKMSWEDAQSAILAKMSPGYSLQFGDTPAQVYKGKLDPIELTVATRSGNKKVTLINNLDTFQVFL